MDDFLASSSFGGPKDGYVFGTGAEGTGYYRDKKRKIDALLAEEDEEVTELDSGRVKRLVLHLEKKLTVNRRERIKFPDDPSKFVDSEVDLDDAVKSLGLLAAAPELYPVLVACGGAKSLASLFEHENTDVAASACSLLYDLTDTDTAGDAFEAVQALAVAFLKEDGLALLASVATRLDERVDDEARALHDLFGVIEHCADLGVLDDVGPILPFLLSRVAKPDFDANKLYASELLAIFLALHDGQVPQVVARTIAGGKNEETGVDTLLQAANVWRKRSPKDEEEEECLANVFDALTGTLENAPQKATGAFVRGEGVELMIRCLREGRHAGAGALKVLDVALSVVPPSYDDRCVAARFIDANGLKVLFPALMGKGAAKPPKLANRRKRAKRGPDDQRATDERILSIVASLCFYAKNKDAPQDAHQRLVSKFAEPDKMPRLVALLRDYYGAVLRESSSREEEDDDDIGAQARILRAGGHALRLVTTAVAFAVVHSPSCRTAFLDLIQSNPSIPTLAQVLLQFATESLEATTTTTTSDDDDDGAIEEKTSDDDVLGRRVGQFRGLQLQDWAAALMALLQNARGSQT